MSTPPRTPPLLVERLRRGELDPATAQRVRASLDAEGGADAHLAALDDSDAQILAAHPPAAVAREVARRRAQSLGDEGLARRRSPWIGLVPVGAVALGALFLLRTPGVEAPMPGGIVQDDTRVKGLGDRLTVHRQAGRGVEQLADGAKAAAGDVLQLTYTAPRAGFGAIVSLDGNGMVTIHLPPEADGASAPLVSGAVTLPRSYALDDAPAFERFFFVTAERPFDAAAVVAAAQALGRDPTRARQAALALPEGLNQTSLTLLKVSR